MKERVLIAGVLATFLLVSTTEAQVAQLGRMSTKGKVKQVGLLGHLFRSGSTVCDSCGDPACGMPDSSCGLASAPGCGIPDPECGIADPECGVAGPSCGMAGSVLSGLHLGRGCGVPEPSCGSAGLGYSGGFGLCGGCDSCGVGGYMGRNLHQVNPCACGGSLVADLARGVITMVDRTVGKIVGGVFGGLQAVTCHASGTLAALQSAAQASCVACGGGGCDGGCAIDPGCGIPMASDYGMANGSVSQGYVVNQTPSPTYATSPTPAVGDIQWPPAPPTAPASIETAPMQPKALDGNLSDPFLDDPTEPQARARTRQLPAGYRQQRAPRNQQVRNTTQQQYRGGRIGSSVQQAGQAVKSASANVLQRYLPAQNRSATIRR